MIKNTEIQLGNFVKDRKGEVLRIDFIEHLEKGCSTKFGMYQEEEYSKLVRMHALTEYTDYSEPIEITGHWLVKLGFEELEESETDEYFYYSKQIKEDTYLDIAFNMKNPIMSLRVISNIRRDEVFYLPDNFKYVHQLQNFISSLK